MKSLKLIFTFLLLLLTLTTCRKDIKNKRIEFINSSELSIGKIKYFVYSGKGNSYIVFCYEINGKEYDGKDGRCSFDSDIAGSKFYNVKEDEKYLVFYKKHTPEESIIRLDYPIKDSLDFKRYEKEFR